MACVLGFAEGYAMACLTLALQCSLLLFDAAAAAVVM
jgi:hypothetical protein